MGFRKLSERYADLWKAIIRPPRDDYTCEDLGPEVFHLGGQTYTRKDVQLRNPRGLTLECSHFEPLLDERPQECLPCVIYMHGNCSSRFEALVTLPILLPHNITVFCFDFAGSGMSEGHYVSLGYYEKDDLAAVVEYLRNAGSVSTIGLWGRSMGAATALLHAHRDLSIGAMVLDSPFTDLRTLAKELVDTYVNFKMKIPKFLVSVVLGWVRTSIKREAKFDISDLNPAQYVSKSFIPALFVAGKGDSFIKPHHTKALYEQYAGDKNLVLVEGDHNTSRPRFCMDGAGFFFYRWLLADQIINNNSTDRIQRTPVQFHLSSCAPLQNNVSPPHRHREAIAAPFGHAPMQYLPVPDEASLSETEPTKRATPPKNAHIMANAPFDSCQTPSSVDAVVAPQRRVASVTTSLFPLPTVRSASLASLYGPSLDPLHHSRGSRCSHHSTASISARSSRSRCSRSISPKCVPSASGGSMSGTRNASMVPQRAEDEQEDHRETSNVKAQTRDVGASVNESLEEKKQQRSARRCCCFAGS